MNDEYNNDINPVDSAENNINTENTEAADKAVNSETVSSATTSDTVSDETAGAAQNTVNSESAGAGAANAEPAHNTVNAAPAPDPYSKYNFYQGAPGNPMYYQGYANQGNPAGNYQNQAYQGQNYGYQAQPGQSGYSTSAPRYNGTYGQPAGYQNAGYTNQGYNNQAQPGQGYQNTGYNNPYPAGQISYVSNVDSIYPGTAPHRTKVKKERSKAAKFFAGLAMSAAFGLVAAGVFILITYFYKEQNPELFTTKTSTVQVTTTESKKDAQLNLDPAQGTKVPSTGIIDSATFTGTDVSNVVQENMSAIVAIDCVTQSYNYWYGTLTDVPTAGSGIIVKKTDTELMVATNNHVIEDTKDIKVKFIDGTTAPAKVKGKDEVVDVAVLTIDLSNLSEDTLKAISVAKIGSSDDTKVGEMAIAIGNALGYGQSVTVGYISGKDRELTIDGQKYTNLLQTDAAINPGNSGGALLNIKGEVIGINNAKIGGSDVEGMGYAIPISKAMNILGEFIDRETLPKEEQGYLGVMITTITEDLGAVYNWPVGIYIKSLDEGGAAEKAGLQVADIITAIDGFKVTDSQSAIDKIQSTRAGTTVTVTVQRRVDGEFVEMNFEAVLGHRPTETTTTTTTPAPTPETEDKSAEQQTPDVNIPDDPKKEDPAQGGLQPGNGGFPGGSFPNGINPGNGSEE
ncbi:MAG: trypsin-like peptidase domain-containing protein [Lachnospiraceae bacterium]|nr:trypsin-like peptidase domain-containing protein [Lachnospiraceae bacterium]